jgi:hypothetical protein
VPDVGYCKRCNVGPWLARLVSSMHLQVRCVSTRFRKVAWDEGLIRRFLGVFLCYVPFLNRWTRARENVAVGHDSCVAARLVEVEHGRARRSIMGVENGGMFISLCLGHAECVSQVIACALFGIWRTHAHCSEVVQRNWLGLGLQNCAEGK